MTKKTIPVKISLKNHSRLFELKCAWRLKSLDEALGKALDKAGAKA